MTMDLEQFENLVVRARGVHERAGFAPFIIDPATSEVKSIEHLQASPDRIRRHMKHDSSPSFIAYANTWKTEHSELFAALVWFSLVSWLMLRTGNIWDCITAHLVTNLLLGVYVIYFGHWQFW